MDPFEVLFWILHLLFEILGEAALDILGAVFEGVFDGLDPGKRFFETFLCFAAGALVGLLSGVVLPERLLPAPRTPGLSLILGPILSGLAMYAWGSFRRERGRATTALATFEGGAAFAFGAALGRFVLVA